MIHIRLFMIWKNFWKDILIRKCWKIFENFFRIFSKKFEKHVLLQNVEMIHVRSFMIWKNFWKDILIRKCWKIFEKFWDIRFFQRTTIPPTAATAAPAPSTVRSATAIPRCRPCRAMTSCTLMTSRVPRRPSPAWTSRACAAPSAPCRWRRASARRPIGRRRCAMTSYNIRVTSSTTTSRSWASACWPTTNVDGGGPHPTVRNYLSFVNLFFYLFSWIKRINSS